MVAMACREVVEVDGALEIFYGANQVLAVLRVQDPPRTSEFHELVGEQSASALGDRLQQRLFAHEEVVEEADVDHIKGFTYSGPYEDLRLKK